ncbi:MAG: ABC transporter permease [Candidatus Aminicenantes bacterium]
MDSRNLRSFWLKIRRHRLAVVGGGVVFLFTLCAVFTPLISPHDPFHGRLTNRFKPPAWMKGGDWTYPLGCDQQGRDLLSRILYGARVSILVGVVVVILSAFIGSVLGLLAGYFGGWLDSVISRIVDILLAFPFMLFAIGMMAFLKPGLMNIIITLTIKGWVPFCRLVRGDTLSAKTREYVEAAESMGAGHGRIMAGEIFPNVLSSVMVFATLNVAIIILLEASLSFLGLGIQPPFPSWGGMVSEGRAYLLEEWWIATFPGLAILIMVMGVNMFGNGLREVLDPRLKSQMR